MIFAFSFYYGIGTNMSAECIALLIAGLIICEKIQVNNIVVKVDSKVMIEVVNENAIAPWNIRPLIRKSQYINTW